MPHGRRWRKGCGTQGRGRPRFHRIISKIPNAKGFDPIDPKTVKLPAPEEDAIVLEIDELEAMRLVDGENLTQDEAGVRMQISRGSIWRLLQSGRRKIITAIFENRPIRISFDSLEKIDETSNEPYKLRSPL
ncbi:MAG: DUF134 domain-containing protein [Candidatus Helarchaeota archaeon]